MGTLQIQPQLLLSMPGGTEWLFIILAVILLFGAKKIPELGRGIGKGIREFKDAKDEPDEKDK
jgi:sec-independent protein translocase protein TatA